MSPAEFELEVLAYQKLSAILAGKESVPPPPEFYEKVARLQQELLQARPTTHPVSPSSSDWIETTPSELGWDKDDPLKEGAPPDG